MYAVIFKASIKQLDDNYTTTANNMRKLAMTRYGCTGFTSCSEGNKEIAISYWPSLEAIKGWKKDIEHQQAQKLGKEKWYSAYQVEVVEVLRQYSYETMSDKEK
tara:strand:- start:17116 stop:17427 length:312 start_codon:yes stop_codon:yes gene_type:complete